MFAKAMSKVLENVGMGPTCDIIFQELSVGGILMIMLLSHSILFRVPMKLSEIAQKYRGTVPDLGCVRTNKTQVS